MGLYTNRILAPTKELSADWFPEEGEIFRDASGNFYCGDIITWDGTQWQNSQP